MVKEICRRARPRGDPEGVQHARRRGEVTLGPKGRNVIIEKSLALPRSPRRCHRRKEIELENKFENMGAQR